MEPRRDLTSLFNSRSVCIVGASADPRRLGGRPLARLTDHKYPGQISLVNPKYREIGGYPCYPSVTELPAPVDVALIILPADMVPGVLEGCGRKGIPNVVVLSSGFEEAPGGDALARKVGEIADLYGMNVVGPNSEGLWSIPYHEILTFGSAAVRDTILEGGVTVLTQSGSLGGGLMRVLQENGIGCRFFVSVGNETVLTSLDYVEYALREGEPGWSSCSLKG